jgi:hypothetical protein
MESTTSSIETKHLLHGAVWGELFSKLDPGHISWVLGALKSHGSQRQSIHHGDTMTKLNCWEAKECGRQPGGFKAHQLGICPAAVETRVHGMNGGINGGRTCWPFSGTLCDDAAHGPLSSKLGACMKCFFYNQVQAEEGPDGASVWDVISRLED